MVHYQHLAMVAVEMESEDGAVAQAQVAGLVLEGGSLAAVPHLVEQTVAAGH